MHLLPLHFIQIKMVLTVVQTSSKQGRGDHGCGSHTHQQFTQHSKEPEVVFILKEIIVNTLSCHQIMVVDIPHETVMIDLESHVIVMVVRSVKLMKKLNKHSMLLKSKTTWYPNTGTSHNMTPTATNSKGIQPYLVKTLYSLVMVVAFICI